MPSIEEIERTLDDQLMFWLLTIGVVISGIGMVLNPVRYAEPKFSVGEIVTFKTGKQVIVKEIVSHPSLINIPSYVVSYENDDGEIHEQYLSEVELK